MSMIVAVPRFAPILARGCAEVPLDAVRFVCESG
jgi:hypothetical protein